MGLQVDDLDFVVVGIGHVEFATGRAQTAGLVEMRRIVAVAGLVIAEKASDDSIPRLADFDLVVICIRDIEVVVSVGKPQAMLKPDLAGFAVDVAELEEAFADDRADEWPRHGMDAGNHTHPRYFGIGHEDVFAVGGQAAGLGEIGRCGGAVDDVLVSGPGKDAHDAGGDVELPDLVRTGHRDVEGLVIAVSG